MARIKTRHRFWTRARPVLILRRGKDYPTSGEGEDPTLHLPCAIMWNILSRLAIERIITCKSVSKTWYQLIENPEFSKVHLKNAMNQQSRFVIQSLSKTYLNTIHILKFHAARLRRIPFQNFHLPSSYEFRLPALRILCSCNGLLCIVSKDKLDPILICNPLIKECVILPSSGPMEGFLVSHNLGFGFDSISRKYKVVRESKYRYDYSISRFEIITLGEKSWRKIASPKSIQGSRVGAAVLWNETLYWKKLVKNTETEKRGILAFNLNEEIFYSIDFPEHSVKEYCIGSRNYEIVVIKGCLSIVEHKGHVMKVWKMQGSKTEGFDFIYQCSVNTNAKASKGMKYETIGEKGTRFLIHVSHKISKGVYEDWLELVPRTEFDFYLSSWHGLPSHFMIVSFKPSFVSPMAELVEEYKPSSLQDLLGLANCDWKYWGGFSCVKPSTATITAFSENMEKK